MKSYHITCHKTRILSVILKLWRNINWFVVVFVSQFQSLTWIDHIAEWNPSSALFALLQFLALLLELSVNYVSILEIICCCFLKDLFFAAKCGKSEKLIFADTCEELCSFVQRPCVENLKLHCQCAPDYCRHLGGQCIYGKRREQ